MLTNCSFIALILGRLRISTLKTLFLYNKLAKTIFYKTNQKSLGKDSIFKAIVLEKKVQKIVALKGLKKHILPINKHN